MASADIPANQAQSNKAFIYVVSASPSVVKIGTAINPESRLKGLQTANHQRLVLSHVVECANDEACIIERKTHNLLRHERISGEWFEVSVEAARIAIERAATSTKAAKANAVQPKIWCMKRKSQRVLYSVIRHGFRVEDVA